MYYKYFQANVFYIIWIKWKLFIISSKLSLIKAFSVIELKQKKSLNTPAIQRKVELDLVQQIVRQVVMEVLLVGQKKLKESCRRREGSMERYPRLKRMLKQILAWLKRFPRIFHRSVFTIIVCIEDRSVNKCYTKILVYYRNICTFSLNRNYNLHYLIFLSYLIIK